VTKQALARLVLGCCALTACGGGGGDGGVNPDSADEVMSALLFKIGASAGTLQAGAPPIQDPGTTPDAPAASVAITGEAIGKATGNNVVVPVSFTSQSRMTNVFARIFGAHSFSRIPVTAGAGGSSVVNVNVELASDFQSGQFCVELSGEDEAHLVSNPQTVCLASLAGNALQGTYRFADDDGTLTFFSDGHYVVTKRNHTPACEAVGLEEGNYSWNPASGELVFSDPKFSFGGCSLVQPQSANLVRHADGTLTFTEPGFAPATLLPVRSTPGTIIGSFQGGDSGTSRSNNRLPIATFLDETHFISIAYDSGPAKNIGIEIGCYAIEPTSRIVTVDLTSNCRTLAGGFAVDTNGPDGGLSHLSGSGTLVITGINSLVSNDGATSNLGTRIPTPGSPP